MQALEQAQDQQEEQGRSIENEIHAYRKDILREQVRNEQLTAILRKVEGEAKFLEGQSDTMRDKQARLQVRLGQRGGGDVPGRAGRADCQHAQQAGVGRSDARRGRAAAMQIVVPSCRTA